MDKLIMQVLSIQKTLDMISIHGREDVSRMLGCMQALDEIITALRQTMDDAEG